jgi:hypothetical protein
MVPIVTNFAQDLGLISRYQTSCSGTFRDMMQLQLATAVKQQRENTKSNPIYISIEDTRHAVSLLDPWIRNPQQKIHFSVISIKIAQ